MKKMRFSASVLAACLLAASVGYAAPASVTAADTVSSSSSNSSEIKNIYSLGGAPSSNINDNRYTTWATTVKSYLSENSDGTVERVEYTSNGVLVERYSSDFKLLSSQYIKAELEKFGGFYSGKDFNYIVFGHGNSGESDTTEILRVVKYTKNWERKTSLSIKGINTNTPFDGGSLRMEEAGGKLYIHTCHKMYKTSDGINHQANMTFVVDESTMKLSDSFSGILNIDQGGYVSHSFNQYVKADDKYLFRVDHGDAYPRDVAVIRSDLSGSVTNVKWTGTIKMGGREGENKTGVTVGGFELSAKNCIVAGTAIDPAQFSSSTPDKYVYITVTSKDMSSTKRIDLAKYSGTGKTQAYTPQLVKVNDNMFLVMWNEWDSGTNKNVLNMVTIDGSGNKISGIVKKNLFISDCQPIVTKDGLVKWYAGSGSSPVLYNINAADLNGISLLSMGDVDGDLKITAADASLVLTEYADLSSTGKSGFTADQTKCADVNSDKRVGADDASVILSYYAYSSGGGTERDIVKWYKSL